MRQFRVETHSWGTNNLSNRLIAEEAFELYQDYLSGEGIDEDGFVSLIYSDDGFLTSHELKRVVPVIDGDKMKSGSPRDQGLDFDFWFKWIEKEAI